MRCLAASLALVFLPGQATSTPSIALPPDRAESYMLYSMLMPVGESAGKGWPHRQFLVEADTVQMVPPDKPCIPFHPDGRRDYTNSLNPHDSVTPPDAERQDYEEILADFDLHCHERIHLDPAAWALTARPSAPLHLLDQAGQKEFQSFAVSPRPYSEAMAALQAKYEGAPGLFSFSEVYFNAHHTVALVQGGVWCGLLCGQWSWSAFRLQDGKWKLLRWNSTMTMS